MSTGRNAEDDLHQSCHFPRRSSGVDDLCRQAVHYCAYSKPGLRQRTGSVDYFAVGGGRRHLTRTGNVERKERTRSGWMDGIIERAVLVNC